MHDNEAQLSYFTFYALSWGSGWTNAVGSVEAINKMLLFHNILHFNMNLTK